MIELLVRLDFDCCGCTHPVSATLRCEGEGLAGEKRQKTPINIGIPCPTCGMINDVQFEPTGRIHRVKPAGYQCRMPEPSIN